MSGLLFSTTLADEKLETGRIPSDWLISGNPETRSRALGRTRDGLSDAFVWECGAVSYRWYYARDEAYIVVSGEGFMTDERGVEHRFGVGDVAFFPAGTHCSWRHPDHFRKVAFVKDPVWPPYAYAWKMWARLLEAVGIRKRGPL